ncbi:ExbD/TolR family protein [Gracilimonas sediminicola]|uniref:Uncharacterized protein n=1 Tax=Gracilimonas sediminicola TaxID=2952158 RepID=A0A9X2L3V1_9BACT|nr:hypothetical protein [Gracilimonas sediminicola]MCP9291769.1 hypothetical protein [Gracilimonas sediminicola]
MRIIFTWLVILSIIISCSSEPETVNHSADNQEKLELVDVRLYENGDMKINGRTLSETAFLDVLEVNEQTKVRISSSDKVYTSLVHRLTREFANRNVGNVHFNMMTSDEFLEYEKNVVIDILESGKIMVDGTLLHTEDLKYAVRNESSKDFSVILSVSNEAIMGTVFDVQKTLKKSGIDRINYSSSSS